MAFHRFIRIRGREGANTGYFVPRLYQLSSLRIGSKIFGFSFIKDRLAGWTFWWVDNEDDYINAVKTLKELKKTRIFEFNVQK